MTRLTTRALVLALLLGTAVGGLADARPAAAALGAAATGATVPQDKSIIAGGDVRLGHLFANIGDAADTVVAKAPAPGQRVTVHASELATIAERFGVDWKPRSFRERVVIERAADQVPMSDVQAALERALMEGPVDDSVEITLANRSLRLLVARGADTTVTVRDLRYDRRSQRFAAVVTAGGNPELVEVNGQVHPIVEVPVPTRHIMPGELINDADVTWQRVRADRTTYNTVATLDDIVGQQARRPLTAGRTVRRTDLKALEMVAKGELATVIFKTPFMTLTTRAKALQSGAKGQAIRLRNLQSDKLIQATVVGPNIVTVEAQSLLALN